MGNLIAPGRVNGSADGREGLTGRTISLPRETSAQIKQDSPAGLLLLDSRNRVVYANSEALRVLAYPKEPQQVKSLAAYLLERIRSLIPNNDTSTRPPCAKKFISGRRHYLCRIFALESGGKNGATLTVAVLMERSHQLSALVSTMAEQFRLTAREQEAVRLLFEGLTSKEIAGRMYISPNTVKTFLRLVMIKMGVSTRSGIVGKVLQA